MAEFDKIMTKFMDDSNSNDDEDIELIFRVENQPFLVKLTWYFVSICQVFYIQKPQCQAINSRGTFCNLNEKKFSNKNEDNQESKDSSIKLSLDNKTLYDLDEETQFNETNKSINKQNQTKDPNSFRRQLKFYNLLKPFSDFGGSTGCFLRVCLIHISKMALTWRSVTLAITQLDYLNLEYQIQKSNHQLAASAAVVWKKEGTGVADQCVEQSLPTVGTNQNSIEYEHNHFDNPNLELLDAIYRQLKELGSPAIEMGSIYAYYMLNMVSLTIVLYLGAIFSFSSKSLYLNSYSFYLDPLNERRRMKEKLIHIVQNLYKTSDYSRQHQFIKRQQQQPSIQSNNSIDESLKSQDYVPKTETSPNISKLMIDILGLKRLDPHSCYCVEDARNRVNLIHLIFKEKLISYVKPRNLNHIHHDIQSRVHSRAQILFIAFISIFAYIAIGIVMVGEVRARTRYRTAILNCKFQHNDSTILSDPHHMKSDPVTDEMIRVYLDHHYKPGKVGYEFPEGFYGETYSQWYFELKQMISYEIIRDYIFLAFHYSSSFLWVIALCIIYLDNWLSQVNWINQLQEQLDDCIRLEDILHKLENCSITTTKNKFDIPEFQCAIRKSHTIIGASSFETKDFNKRINIEKALIITYLNFELFRQEYKYFRRLCNYITIHLIPLILFNSIMSYYFVTSTWNKDILGIWIANFLYIIFLNYFVGTSMYVIERIQSLYRTINILLAKSCLNSQQLTYVSKLWKLQMMSEIEVGDAFCMQVFGNNFVLSTLIAVDSYVFALWLILIRCRGRMIYNE